MIIIKKICLLFITTLLLMNIKQSMSQNTDIWFGNYTYQKGCFNTSPNGYTCCCPKNEIVITRHDGVVSFNAEGQGYCGYNNNFSVTIPDDIFDSSCLVNTRYMATLNKQIRFQIELALIDGYLGLGQTFIFQNLIYPDCSFIASQ